MSFVPLFLRVPLDAKVTVAPIHAAAVPGGTILSAALSNGDVVVKYATQSIVIDGTKGGVTRGSISGRMSRGRLNASNRTVSIAVVGPSGPAALASSARRP